MSLLIVLMLFRTDNKLVSDCITDKAALSLSRFPERELIVILSDLTDNDTSFTSFVVGTVVDELFN